MDRVAVISDLHGNLTAARAVRDDLRELGIEVVFCLGDLVGKGPDPVGTIELAGELAAATVRGNWETAVLSGVHEPLVDWQRDQLDADHLGHLAGFPGSIDLQVSGRWVRMFHASSRSETHRVFRDSDEQELDAMFANTPFTGYEHPEPDVVLYGDLHDAFLITRGQRTLINAGSVGNPLDGLSAAYLIMSGDLGSGRAGAFGVEVRRVPYDIEAEVRIARESGMPGTAPYVRELRTAVYRAFH